MIALKNILKNRILAGALIALLVTLFLAMGIIFGFFEKLHLKFSNSLYTRNENSQDIVIIGIDEKSTKSEPDGLGFFSSWNRENYVKLLDQLKSENPKVIAFDILFYTPTKNFPTSYVSGLNQLVSQTDSGAEKLKLYEKFVGDYGSLRNNKIDSGFAAKLVEFNNIILAFSSDPVKQIYPLPQFSENVTLGDIYSEQDIDGLMRRAKPIAYVESDKKYYDDIALAAAKIFLEKDQIDLPLEDDKLMVNYFGDPFSFSAVSFVDVLDGNFEPGTFKDKIVLIGVTTFKEIQDKVTTPRSSVLPMPGVEFRANEIQTILEGKFLTNQSKIAQVLTVFVISAALTIALNFSGIILAVILTLAAILLYIAAAHFLYYRGLIVNMVYPFFAIVISYLASWVYKYFVADRDKRQLTSAFSHYVSDDLVQEIAKNPDMVKLGGEKKVITVFFSDIKNSTGYSEKTPIELWVSQINEYFTAMEQILQNYGGTLDKYEGDAIMGFWNAPIAQPDHIVRAYFTAIAMQKTLKQLHAKWQQEGKPLIEFRIGINTGEALVGNFGSENRFDYTVMGDTVNTASRLESSANKTYGTSIIATGFEGRIDSAALSKFVIRELDTVILPGKEDAVKIYELLCLAEESTPEIANAVATYSKGLATYRAKDFATAITAFELLPNDAPAKIMLERCRALSAGGTVPGLSVDMVFRIANK